MIELFRKQYNPMNYHCVHFVIDAGRLLFNKDYSKSFIGLTSSLAETIKTSRSTATNNKLIKKPVDGCIVLMTYQDNSSHVGLYYKNRVIHLTECGVQRLTVDQISLYFKRMRFYEPNFSN